MKGITSFYGSKKRFKRYLEILKKLAYLERYGWLYKGGE